MKSQPGRHVDSSRLAQRVLKECKKIADKQANAIRVPTTEGGVERLFYLKDDCVHPTGDVAHRHCSLPDTSDISRTSVFDYGLSPDGRINHLVYYKSFDLSSGRWRPCKTKRTFTIASLREKTMTFILSRTASNLLFLHRRFQFSGHFSTTAYAFQIILKLTWLSILRDCKLLRGCKRLTVPNPVIGCSICWPKSPHKTMLLAFLFYWWVGSKCATMLFVHPEEVSGVLKMQNLYRTHKPQPPSGATCTELPVHCESEKR